MVLNGNVIHNKILQRFYTSHYVEMLVYGIIMQKKIPILSLQVHKNATYSQ
jgi:hypothetical protein